MSIQAQILNLLKDLQDDFGVAYLFVAHDLAVVRQISHRVAVMYLGKIMEPAPRSSSTRHPPPVHALPALCGADPGPGAARNRGGSSSRATCPSPIDPPAGCVFRTRCFQAQEKCAPEVPPLVEISPGHHIACHFPIEAKDLPKRIEVQTEQTDGTEAVLSPTAGATVDITTPR